MRGEVRSALPCHAQSNALKISIKSRPLSILWLMAHLHHILRWRKTPAKPLTKYKWKLVLSLRIKRGGGGDTMHKINMSVFFYPTTHIASTTNTFSSLLSPLTKTFRLHSNSMPNSFSTNSKARVF